MAIAIHVDCACDITNSIIYHLTLEVRGLQVGEDEEQPSFRRRQGTVLGHRTPVRSGEAIEAPRGPPRLERRLEGQDQLLKLVERHAGEIEKLCRAGLQVSEPSTSQSGGLHASEAQ